MRRHPGRILWAAVFVVVVALGVWGFLRLPPRTGASAGEALLDAGYRTVRLFTLNLDVPDGTPVPWQVWIAAFVAPLVTARGVAALFKDRLSGVVTQYVTEPQIVVFGANTRTAALVAAEPVPTGLRGAIVVVDPDAVALATITGMRVRKVVGDGTSPLSLARTGVGRTSTVVVCTGDHVRNSSITTEVLAMHARPGLDLYVEVDGHGLVSVLEQGRSQAGARPTPFSAPVLAMEAVLDRLESERRAVGSLPLLAVGEHGDPSTIVLFGTGALVDATMLDLYRRRRFQLLESTATSGAPPRVVLFGPDAVRRRAALVTLLGTELQVFDVDAVDAPLGQAVELDVGTVRHLARYRPRQVIVLVPSDPDGGIAAALARYFGRPVELVVVNESPTTPICDEIERQTANSPVLSRVRMFRVTEHAYKLALLAGERRADRLARALAADGRSSLVRRAAARRMIAAAEAANVVVRRDALAVIDPPHLDVLKALDLVPPLAFARARLTVDFQDPQTVARAAHQQLVEGSTTAFATWCEVARLADGPAVLRPAAPPASDGISADIGELLVLRRATLGDRDDSLALPSGADSPTGPIVVLCAGPSDDARTGFLRITWAHFPQEITVWTTALADSDLVRAGIAQGVSLRPSVGDAATTARRRAHAIWRTILGGGGDAAKVRVVALPGADIEEVLIARALGATVGRVETAAGADLPRTVLGGAAGIVPLPDDRMTIRAFIRKSVWPAEDGRPRVACARAAQQLRRAAARTQRR